MKKKIAIILIIVFLVIGVYIIKKTNIFNNGKIIYNVNNKTDQNNVNEQNQLVNEYRYRVYLFGSKSCPACKNLESLQNEMKDKYKDIEFRYIDVDKQELTTMTYKIQYTPTFVISDNKGNEINRKIGEVSSKEFESFIQENIK